jgi:hypothetical protein
VTTEVRCPNKLHLILGDGFVETTCNSKFCGKAPGIVVLHRWSIETGDLIQTLKFKQTNQQKEASSNGTCQPRSSVRRS